jgi:hypothetical protein
LTSPIFGTKGPNMKRKIATEIVAGMRVRHVKTGDTGTVEGLHGGYIVVTWDAGSYVKSGPLHPLQIEAIAGVK